MVLSPDNVTLGIRILVSLLLAANLARYRQRKKEFLEGHVTGWWDWLNRNPVEAIHFVVFIVVLAPGLIEGVVDLGAEILLEE